MTMDVEEEFFAVRLAFPEQDVADAFQSWYDSQGRVLFEQYHKTMLYNLMEEASNATKQ